MKLPKIEVERLKRFEALRHESPTVARLLWRRARADKLAALCVLLFVVMALWDALGGRASESVYGWCALAFFAGMAFSALLALNHLVEDRKVLRAVIDWDRVAELITQNEVPVDPARRSDGT